MSIAPDARLSVTLPSHPKTKRLIRRCGTDGAWRLVCLILWTTQAHPNGVLDGMTDEDIELSVDWSGEPGGFVRALVEVGFLDGPEGARSLHDWHDHNPWIAGHEQRADKARRNALIRHHGREKGERMFHVDRARRNARSTGNDASSNASSNASSTNEQCTQHESALLVSATCNAPSPYPSPNPKPNPKPNKQKASGEAFSGELRDAVADSPSEDDDDPPELTPELELACQQCGPEPVVCIPTNRSGEEYRVLQPLVDELVRAYPAVDVLGQLREMRMWSITNPKLRKTAGGMLRFVNGWLSREQNRRGARRNGSHDDDDDDMPDDATLIERASTWGLPQ